MTRRKGERRRAQGTAEGPSAKENAGVPKPETKGPKCVEGPSAEGRGAKGPVQRRAGRGPSAERRGVGKEARVQKPRVRRLNEGSAYVCVSPDDAPGSI